MTDYLWTTRGSLLRERGLDRGDNSGAQTVDMSMTGHLIEAAAAFAPERRRAA